MLKLHLSDTEAMQRRLSIAVRGIVQGVGFRPFVYQAARSLGLIGWVRNEAGIVRIEAQGAAASLERFVHALRSECPPQARVDNIAIDEVLASQSVETGRQDFEIRVSAAETSPRPTLPADLAICDACLAEIRDPAERRYNYPFTNCTNCGPRWSIIERAPYDRERTTMRSFRLCSECRAEFDFAADRRFHAQPIACPRCGPSMQLLDCEGAELAIGEAAMADAVQSVLTGRIVAMKGLGGFQLLVDATDDKAIARLRARKRRPDRPFALMMGSLAMVRQYCMVSDEEAEILGSPRAPIVLLRRKESHSDFNLSMHIAGDNPYLGVMLPYTPLHHLLVADIARPIVCTSGNLSEEPMAIETEDALDRLSEVADLFLTHDRKIVRPVDDSIVRVESDGVRVLRRARGYAPLPLEIRGNHSEMPPILAVGGHLKNTIALALSRFHEDEPTQVVLSSHIGDLDNRAGVEVFARAIDDLVHFFDATPSMVVCDLHPDYASTRHAERLAAAWSAVLTPVQHHHAHIAACMAEHAMQGPVLGFAWDGVGYGPDGTVWGGETLVCHADRYRRVAHLRTFALPGGDRATREPRRSALGLLYEMLGTLAAPQVEAWFKPEELEPLFVMLQRRVNAPRTSSMGRLFDAVAAICGLYPKISFEGQAAMALEYAADRTEQAGYPISLSDGEPSSIDWEPMMHVVLADRAAGVSVGRISARFHNTLADMAVMIAKAKSPASGDCVLSGGCFQNALLSSRVCERLRGAGFRVYTHHQVPPGDGGIALGQVFVALNRGCWASHK